MWPKLQVEGINQTHMGGLGCSYICKCAFVKPDPDFMVTCTGIMQSTLYSAVKEYSLKFQHGIFNSILETCSLNTCGFFRSLHNLSTSNLCCRMWYIHLEYTTLNPDFPLKERLVPQYNWKKA